MLRYFLKQEVVIFTIFLLGITIQDGYIKKQYNWNPLKFTLSYLVAFLKFNLSAFSFQKDIT